MKMKSVVLYSTNAAEQRAMGSAMWADLGDERALIHLLGPDGGYAATEAAEHHTPILRTSTTPAKYRRDFIGVSTQQVYEDDCAQICSLKHDHHPTLCDLPAGINGMLLKMVCIGSELRLRGHRVREWDNMLLRKDEAALEDSVGMKNVIAKISVFSEWLEAEKKAKRALDQVASLKTRLAEEQRVSKANLAHVDRLVSELYDQDADQKAKGAEIERLAEQNALLHEQAAENHSTAAQDQKTIRSLGHQLQNEQRKNAEGKALKAIASKNRRLKDRMGALESAVNEVAIRVDATHRPRDDAPRMYDIFAENFARGTSAEDIEVVMMDVGPSLFACRLVGRGSRAPVTARIVFSQYADAKRVIDIFNNKKADNRVLRVCWGHEWPHSS